MIRQLQHGDVNITEIHSVPEGAIPAGHNVLRDGEVTGHAHRVTGSAEVLTLGDRVLLNVMGGDCRVVHEEHAPITIPPGVYEVTPTHENDYDTEETRNVID